MEQKMQSLLQYVRNINLEIANFLNGALTFVHKVRMKLEASGSNISTDSKSKNTF